MLALRELKKFLEMFMLLEKTIFYFFIEAKINNSSCLNYFGQSDIRVPNCFLNVLENN